MSDEKSSPANLFRAEALAHYAAGESAPGQVLRRRGRRGRRVPYMQPMQASECGTACLAMVLNYYGRAVSLDEVRQVLSAGPEGTTALTLLEGGRWFGLTGRGVKLEIEDLDCLETGAILHWEFNHFVVFERLARGSVHILDPGTGRRQISLDEFRRSFTGVAVLLEPGEEFQVSGHRSAPWWRYIRRVLQHRGLLTQVVLTSALLQVLVLGTPLLTGMLVDRVLPAGDLPLLQVLGAGLAAMTLFYGLAAWVRSHLWLSLRTLLDKELTLGFIAHLVTLPFSFFQGRSTGDLMMRANSNSTIREMVTASALSALLDGGLAFLYLVLILLASPLLGALTLALGLLQVGVLLLTRRRYQNLTADVLVAQAKSQSYLIELLSGIETLKACSAEGRAVEHWSNLFVNELNVSLGRGRLTANTETAIAALRVGSPLVLLFSGGLQVMNGSLTLGTMLALQAMAASFLLPLSGLINTALQLHVVQSYIERVADVLETPGEQAGQTQVRAGRLQGHIALDQVTYRYGALLKPALQDLSLEIRPGQFVGIVGPSGSGKSTLGKLLAGLYAPTDGRIQYDGMDAATLEMRSVRAQIGVVPQEPFLFGRSIRANIALTDPTVPLAAVVTAARMAQVHDEIVALPMGYETVLADSGHSLSGGQRQRIALARALVREPAVLVLDEATSALDTLAERRVQDALASLQCTRIVIAQRLSTVRNADLILVLENGRVTERGTHEELMARGGMYAALAGR